MNRLFLNLIIILSPFLLFSQQTLLPSFKISGKIVDGSSNTPLEYASIILKNQNSDSIITGCISNFKGKFTLDISSGNYNLIVDYMSYKTKIIPIKIDNDDLNVGTVSLELDIESLNEIQIVGEKKVVEFKPNKYVFNITKDIASQGTMASDILNNIPQVSVESDGEILLRGFEKPTILINGKITSLSSADAIKTIPANSIEKVEVLTNPGAKYRASASSIINIILKKGKDEGLNGSFTGAGGYRDYYGGLLTLNHKSSNVNFYTNTSFFHRNRVVVANYNNQYFSNNQTIALLNERSVNDNKDKGFYGTIGADIELSKKATLSTAINFTSIDNNAFTLTNSTILDPSEVQIDTNTRDYDRNLKNEAYDFIIDYEQHFKKEGQTFSASITRTVDKEKYTNIFDNSNSSFFTEDFVEDNELTNTVFNTQFTSPLGKSSTITFGYMGEIGEVPFSYLSNIENDFIDFSDNSHAGFIDFENQSDKFYLGVGLRAEFVDFDIDYLSQNNTISKSFDNLFPSAYLEYYAKENKVISLSYNKSIARPSYYQLQPYQQQFSETSSYIGNVNLNPVFIDASTLTYTYFGKSITVAASLFFNHYNDYWQEVTYETGENINGVNNLITTPTNLGSVNYYGASLTTVIKASKQLNFTATANIYNFDQKGVFETTNSLNQPIVLDYTMENFNGSFSLLSQLKIPNVVNFQSNLKHTLLSEGAYSFRKPYTYINASVSKDLFDNDATISFTIDDIFLSNKVIRNRFDTNYVSRIHIQNKYRNLIFSFTYRFNQSKRDRKIDFNKKDIKPNY